MIRRNVLAWLVRGTLAVALVASLCPGLAYAEGSSAESSVADKFAQQALEAIGRFDNTGIVDYLRDVDSYEENEEEGISLRNGPLSPSFPSSYDLRDEGVVTSVKQQNPWGACWGFAAIAASETSIMSSLGLNAADGEIDLSELHTAWFAYTPLPEDEGSQGGEGIYATAGQSSDILNSGGLAFTATSIFSSGIGPVFEDDAPYRNKEGIKLGADGIPFFYASEGDWSVSEGIRFLQAFELEESSILPSPALRDDEGNYQYNQVGTDAIKQEVSDGRAVEIAFCADTFTPGETGSARYINTDTWAHYTYDDAEVTHAVTIVGWDDSYSKDNFIEGHQPESDGAWIVKNSWGSVDAEFPHANPEGWGVDGSGYFYLSYYDKSLSLPESFEYKTDSYGEGADYYLINQYDYLPSSGVSSIEMTERASMANVFEAEESQTVRALSCETASPGSTVTYQLYLLNEAYSNPQDGTLLTEFSETYQYGGYHRAQLDESFFVAKGQHYSVVATVTSSAGYEIFADAALNKKSLEYMSEREGTERSTYAVGVVNRGESFLCEEGTWSDWVDGIDEIKETLYVAEKRDIYDYDNFALKAYADPAADPPSSKTVAVPDLSNLTEAEALLTLEQLGLRGQAGEPQYSDSVEAGRVSGQDFNPGAYVDEGSLVTYYLSLGKDGQLIQGAGEEDAPGSLSASRLASTGDPSLSATTSLAAIAIAAAVFGSVARRARGRRSEQHRDPR